jgi:hypothetical protein
MLGMVLAYQILVTANDQRFVRWRTYSLLNRRYIPSSAMTLACPQGMLRYYQMHDEHNFSHVAPS